VLHTASSVFTLSRLAKELHIFLEDGFAWQKVNAGLTARPDFCGTSL
jgi:hypothetical protein